MGKKIIRQNVLVTGGTGFIGSHLVRELVARQNNVIVLDIQRKRKSFFVLDGLEKKVKFFRVDVRDKAKLISLTKKYHPTYFFHLAARAIVEDVYANPDEALETNILGTINVLEAARQNKNTKAVLVTSSDKAYGKKTSKYVESDALKGDHPYEVSKSAADLISITYAKTYCLPVVVTRFGNVYGEGDLNFSRIIPGIMEAIIKKQKLAIRSNGKYVRDYLYVADVVRGSIELAECIQKTTGEAYNFGSQETLSVIQLIHKIGKILKIKIPYTIRNTVKNEIPRQSLNYNKIRHTISWVPRASLATTIPDVYAYYKKIV